MKERIREEPVRLRGSELRIRRRHTQALRAVIRCEVPEAVVVHRRPDPGGTDELGGGGDTWRAVRLPVLEDFLPAPFDVELVHSIREDRGVRVGI